eukprot:6978175-Pyramimonas_sp.AAC.1
MVIRRVKALKPKPAGGPRGGGRSASCPWASWGGGGVSWGRSGREPRRSCSSGARPSRAVQAGGGGEADASGRA